MKVIFEYNKEKDIWCLLNKGKGSNNSKLPTKVYEKLTETFGENPTPENTSAFIEKYISENNIDVQEYMVEYQKEWDKISYEYQKRAEKIFGVSLPKGITAYLTINNRCPYDIENNSFFVSMSDQSSVTKTTMHELWHFYTWHGLGAMQLEKLGRHKYNDLKEALTVLLNLECKDLLPEGVQDNGYPQHKELREKITELWKQEKNIFNLWEDLTQEK